MTGRSAAGGIGRRDLLKTGLAAGVAIPVAAVAAIPEHNWEAYDWGATPPVPDRLY